MHPSEPFDVVVVVGSSVVAPGHARRASVLLVADFATGINFDHTPLATADKFVHACEIVDNYIRAATAGIRIDEHNVASGCLIARNVIARPTKGIDENNGNALCVGNWITAGTDAIEHANSATLCIGNHVIDAAVGAVEASGTD